MKRLIAIFLSVSIASSSWASITLVTGAHLAKTSTDSNGYTTSAINTTGATLLVAIVCYYNPDAAPTFSDSKTNSWSQLNIYNSINFNTITLYYVSNPTTDTAQTFTIGGNGVYSGVAVAGFSGTASTPFDQQNGAETASATTQQPGNVAPTQDNELVVSGMTFGTTGTLSVNSGFTITDQVNFNANGFGVGLGYIINGSGTSGVNVNPTWTNSGAAGGVGSNIATFKALATGIAVTVPNNRGLSIMGGKTKIMGGKTIVK